MLGRYPESLTSTPAEWSPQQRSLVVSLSLFFSSKKSGCKTETSRKIVDVLLVIVYLCLF